MKKNDTPTERVLFACDACGDVKVVTDRNNLTGDARCRICITGTLRPITPITNPST